MGVAVVLRRLTHAMLIVGYGTTADSKPYWKLKNRCQCHGCAVVHQHDDGNSDVYMQSEIVTPRVHVSWGKDWGNGGFGKFARGKNMCSIANLASYPVLDDPGSWNIPGAARPGGK